MAETNIIEGSLLQAPLNVEAGAPVSEPTPEEPPKEVAPTEPVVVQPPVGEPIGDVTVISDREAQERTDENLARLEEDLARPELQPLAVEGIGVIEAGEGVFRDPNTGQLTKITNVDINAENILNRNLEFVAGVDISPEVRQTQEAKRKGLTPDELSKLGVTTPEEDEVTKAREALATERQGFIAEIDKLRATATVQSQALIDSIGASFDVRERQLGEANQTALETLRILGIRSGRQRFAAEVQTGILSAEERAGIQRLADLDAQEKTLIAQAQQAATNKDFELLNAKITLADKVAVDKLNALEDQLKMSKELETQVREKTNQIFTESSILNLFDQGITSISEIQKNLLNAGLPVTVDEIANILESLGQDLDLSGQAKEFQSFVDIGLVDSTLPKSEQWRNFLNLTKEDKVLTVAQAKILGVPFGTTESQAYGIIIPQSDVIDLTSTERKDLRNSVAAGETLLDLATQYRKIVSERGFTSRIFGDKALIGTINGLRAQMTAAYKDAKKLGTLDEGLLTLMEDIIGIEPTSGLFTPFKNIFRGPQKQIIANIDTLIDTTNNELERDKQKLGLETVGVEQDILQESVEDVVLGQDDVNEVDEIISEFNPEEFFE